MLVINNSEDNKNDENQCCGLMDANGDRLKTVERNEEICVLSDIKLWQQLNNKIPSDQALVPSPDFIKLLQIYCVDDHLVLWI